MNVGAFIIVMAWAPIYTCYTGIKIFSINPAKETHLWSGYHGVVHLSSTWALEVILFLTLFHPFFNSPHWHEVVSYLQADDMWLYNDDLHFL